MTDKYKNRYRIASVRLQHWDYGSNAAYFVTICTKNKECCFGEIMGRVPVLSELGKTAQQCWMDIPKHFPFVVLGEFIVMPNHVHGIVVIDKPGIGDAINDMNGDANVETPKLGVSTATGQPQTRNATKKWGSASLGVIINQYKRAVTMYARLNAIDFYWQTRYHDHIIRNDKSYKRITEYIIDNPLNWEDDAFFNHTP